MGLEKAGVKANEAIVIENAPIGVQAGVAAGIFTVAVNTAHWMASAIGCGADLLFPSMQAFCDNWEIVRKSSSHKNNHKYYLLFTSALLKLIKSL